MTRCAGAAAGLHGGSEAGASIPKHVAGQHASRLTGRPAHPAELQIAVRMGRWFWGRESRPADKQKLYLEYPSGGWGGAESGVLGCGCWGRCGWRGEEALNQPRGRGLCTRDEERWREPWGHA